LRVAVDHDGLVARLPEREAGVHAAVVEFDPLADAVGTAAEDHHLATIGGASIAEVAAVGGVKVGHLSVGLRRVGADAAKGGVDAEVAAEPAHLALGRPREEGEAAVGKPLRLVAPKRLRVAEAVPRDLPLLL